MHLIAKKRLSYAKHRYQVGEAFTATAADGALLVAAGVASKDPHGPVKAPPPVAEDAPKDALPKRRRAKVVADVPPPVDVVEPMALQPPHDPEPA